MSPLTLNPLGALGGVLAAGAVGALAWNFAPVIGPQAVQARLNKALGAATSTIAARDATLKAVRDQCKATTAERDALLIANGKTESSNAEQTAAFWQGQCATAYKAGAARAAVPATPPRPAAGPGLGLGVGTPVGVRGELRDLWAAGAYPGSANRGPGGVASGNPAGAPAPARP